MLVMVMVVVASASECPYGVCVSDLLTAASGPGPVSLDTQLQEQACHAIIVDIDAEASIAPISRTLAPIIASQNLYMAQKR